MKIKISEDQLKRIQNKLNEEHELEPGGFNPLAAYENYGVEEYQERLEQIKSDVDPLMDEIDTIMMDFSDMWHSVEEKKRAGEISEEDFAYLDTIFFDLERDVRMKIG
jgi:hypothetical protein